MGRAPRHPRGRNQEGIVPGGGVALLPAPQAVEKMKLEGGERIGAQILKDALSLPVRTIVHNAGENGSLAVAEVLDRKEKNFGYDALTKTYGDMLEMGILDPLGRPGRAAERGGPGGPHAHDGGRDHRTEGEGEGRGRRDGLTGNTEPGGPPRPPGKHR